MTVAARVLVAVSCIVCAVVLAAQTATQTPTQGPFRAYSDLVSVPVTVRSRNAPVTDLRAADFIVTDTGVEQRIDRIDTEALPIDVTLILDTSGSTEPVIGQLQRDAREIAAVIRPQDRLRLLTIDTYATEVFPFQAGTPKLAFDPPANGLSSVHDTITAALLERVPLDRRHLIVTMTDGIDSISGLAANAVTSAARVSDAVLEIFLVDTLSAWQTRIEFSCLMMGRCEREARFWLPYQDREYRELSRAAAITGGDSRSQGLVRNRTAVGVFKAAFDDFRQSYVIRYVPRGVKRDGWHPIDVRLRAPQGRTLRARQGYLIGTREPDPAPLPPLVAGALPTTLPLLLREYERGNFGSVIAGLGAIRSGRDVLSRFRSGGNPWPDTPRREAVFVLELASVLIDSADVRTRDDTAAMLDWYRKLVRHPLEPDSFERFWYWAEIALLESILDPGRRPMPAIDNALRRFPGEPRFLLARAVVLDQAWPFGTAADPSDAGGTMPTKERAAAIVAAYEAAAVEPDVRFEAKIRLGFFLYRMGRFEEALVQLNMPGAPDNELSYFQGLFHGKTLEALGRLDEADKFYRQALTAWPDAQSARVAVMTLALRRGDVAAAEAMAETIETQSKTSFDPFWQYTQGDGRIYSAIRELLRRSIR